MNKKEQIVRDTLEYQLQKSYDPLNIFYDIRGIDFEHTISEILNSEIVKNAPEENFRIFMYGNVVKVWGGEEEEVSHGDWRHSYVMLEVPYIGAFELSAKN